MSTARRSRALVLPGSGNKGASSPLLGRRLAAHGHQPGAQLEHRGWIEARRGKMGHRPPEAGLVQRAHGQLEAGVPVCRVIRCLRMQRSSQERPRPSSRS